uniref:Ground-like domain-containing protein n=1 Tax=Globodera rostochiensis TaxID=31243 RepID=A0A914HSD9_GLORO
MVRVGGGARLHAATQFAARARPVTPKNTDTVFFSDSGYEPVAAAGGEQLPPPPPLPPKPKSRGKYQRPGTTVAVVPSPAASSNVPSSNNKGHEWAYIKKPKKQGGRTRPPVAAPAPVQAVTPASGTALGGVGMFFTALPPGVKGSHLQTINSKNLPTVNEAHRYYYPPRMPLPLPTCFHNPTGYPCCNPTLNDLMVETYTDLESKPKFHTCNINAIALHLQIRAEERFNTSFETVAAFDDFAQKIHFYSDLVCKVELGGKYMLAYATVKDVDRVLSTEQPAEPEQSNAIGSVTPNSAGGASRNGAGGGYAANLIRQKRAAAASPTAIAFIGPLQPLAADDLSRRYTMWI